RVEGKLDPKHNDRVDWWILQRYDPSSTILDVPKDARFRVDPPFVTEDGARLRVVATSDEPVEYSFEFRRSDKSGNLKVVIHESPNALDAKFPF
ncbi:MAG: hypothetical protein HY000_16085, partial [Planctomycetes bacterium]|nr:hypothetical protein [Planctomycetota bacterium]